MMTPQQQRSPAKASLTACRDLHFTSVVRRDTITTQVSVTQSAKEPHTGPYPLRSLMPIQRLATTSITRRGTIAAQQRIIAATRLHKGTRSVCAHDDAAATTLPCVGVAYRARVGTCIPLALLDETLYQCSGGALPLPEGSSALQRGTLAPIPPLPLALPDAELYLYSNI